MVIVHPFYAAASVLATQEAVSFKHTASTGGLSVCERNHLSPRL